jgi:hypothetical protein
MDSLFSPCTLPASEFNLASSLSLLCRRSFFSVADSSRESFDHEKATL